MNEKGEQSDSDGITVQIGKIEKPKFNELGKIEEKKNIKKTNQPASHSRSDPNETTVELVIKPKASQAVQQQNDSEKKKKRRNRKQKNRNAAAKDIKNFAASKRFREAGGTPPNSETPRKQARRKSGNTTATSPGENRSIGVAPSMSSSTSQPETIKNSAVNQNQSNLNNLHSNKSSANDHFESVSGQIDSNAVLTQQGVADLSTDENAIANLSNSLEQIQVDTDTATEEDTESAPSVARDTETLGNSAGKDNSNSKDNPNDDQSKRNAPGPSYSKVVDNGSLIIALIDQRQEGSMTLLDHFRFSKLRSIIGDKILSQADKKKPLPRIIDSRLASGAMKIHCGDHNTRRWLVHCITTIPTKDLWIGAKLKLIDFCDLPKPHKFQAWFPGIQKSAVDIFKLIERLNEGISTKSWSVLSKEQKKGGTSMVIGVGSESYASLTKPSSPILCGMGIATFHLIKGCPANKDAVKKSKQIAKNDLRNRITPKADKRDNAHGNGANQPGNGVPQPGQ